MGKFDEPVYFSESQKQLVRVADMPLQYAKNVLFKLHGEEGFADSLLERSLLQHLMPSARALAAVMMQEGRALCLCPPGAESAIRARFYEAGRIISKKISTHKEGVFIEGAITVNVRVRSHA